HRRWDSFDTHLTFLQVLNMFAKGFIGSFKINRREKHANDEKGKESLKRLNSSSQDGSESEICRTGIEEVHSRMGPKHCPSTCAEKRRTAEMTRRVAPSVATLGLSFCSWSLIYSKPVLQAQSPHSLWLSIIAMLSFLLFACAATVMDLVAARFTHTQIIVLLIAFFALVLA
ncbi:hypothetical protein V8G54_009318, partial [Vigna mungo]